MLLHQIKRLQLHALIILVGKVNINTPSGVFCLLTNPLLYIIPANKPVLICTGAK